MLGERNIEIQVTTHLMDAATTCLSGRERRVGAFQFLLCRCPYANITQDDREEQGGGGGLLLRNIPDWMQCIDLGNTKDWTMLRCSS